MTTDVPVSGSGQHDVAIIGAGLSGLVPRTGWWRLESPTWW